MSGMLVELDDFVPEALSGFCDLHRDIVRQVPGGVVRSRTTRKDKVALVVGGGSGHYPAFAGYVGAGLADGAVVGNIFASPSSRQVRDVARAAEGGKGVLLSFGNYTGDVLNFELAAERLRSEGVPVRIVKVTDDVASAPEAQRSIRRGVAGDLVVFKIAGAAAERGLSLDAVADLAQSANDATRTFGIAFRGCTMPGASTPLFSLPPGHMGVGMGIHGEPGVREQPLCNAQTLAALLAEPLLAEMPAGAPRPVVVLNGLGATKGEELFYLWHYIRAYLRAQGVEPIAAEAGEFVTSFDMGGCSLTMSWLHDELLDLWHSPAFTPALRRGAFADLVEVGAVTVPAPPPPAGRAADAAETARVRKLVRALEAIAAALGEAEPELNRLDAIAGDGDHGRSMAAGARAAALAAGNAHGGEADLGAALISAADAWCDASGGTSGALWAAGLRSAASSLEPGRSQPLSALQDAADTVMRLAGARAGDKTVVDALLAAVEAAQGGTLREIAAAATRGAEATASMAARAGRARPLAARSVGHPDAGATSFAMCLRIAAQILEHGE